MKDKQSPDAGPSFKQRLTGYMQMMARLSESKALQARRVLRAAKREALLGTRAKAKKARAVGRKRLQRESRKRNRAA